AVSKIKRAHKPLKRVFNILKAKISTCTDNKDILQIAVKALNNTTGPHRIILTLLIFRAYLRINKDLPPTLDIIVRANAVQKATRII
ncbi:hypothetical protein K504DRAFT_384503, partial [Pleomassaria siparia CBS 279.74]